MYAEQSLEDKIAAIMAGNFLPPTTAAGSVSNSSKIATVKPSNAAPSLPVSEKAKVLSINVDEGQSDRPEQLASSTPTSRKESPSRKSEEPSKGNLERSPVNSNRFSLGKPRKSVDKMDIGLTQEVIDELNADVFPTMSSPIPVDESDRNRISTINNLDKLSLEDLDDKPQSGADQTFLQKLQQVKSMANMYDDKQQAVLAPTPKSIPPKSENFSEPKHDIQAAANDSTANVLKSPQGLPNDELMQLLIGTGSDAVSPTSSPLPLSSTRKASPSTPLPKTSTVTGAKTSVASTKSPTGVGNNKNKPADAKSNLSPTLLPGRHNAVNKESQKSIHKGNSAKNNAAETKMQLSELAEEQPPRPSTSPPRVSQSNHVQTYQEREHSTEHNSRYTTPNRTSSRSRNSSPLSTVSLSSTCLEHPVKVAVRVRPFSDYELDHNSKRTISKYGQDLIVVNPNAFDVEPDVVAKAALAINDKQWAHPFRFDEVLWSHHPASGHAKYIDQAGLHQSIGLDIVENALNGVSCTCFAYGPSATGKTYSLFGPSALPTTGKSLDASKRRSKSPTSLRVSQTQLYDQQDFELEHLTTESGITARVFHDIIVAIKTSRIKIPNNRIFFSFLEIYNDKVIDLLSDAAFDTSFSNGAHQLQAEGLKVREHPAYGPYCENLRKVEVFTPEEVFRLIAKGQQRRTTTRTVLNPETSRSHVVVTLELSSADLNELLQMAGATDPKARRSHASLNESMSAFPNVIKIQIVDLAGADDIMKEEDASPVWQGAHYIDSPSRRSSDPGIEKEKNELKCIRRSLNTLSHIVQSLSKGAVFKSLPYRDSKLTFLLRDALNGFNFTTMLTTISPSHLQFEETLSTLRYSENLCSIRKKTWPSATASKPQGSKPKLIEEFRKFHQDIGSQKKGTLAARQLLTHTIADPQQRIAKLTRAATNEPQYGVLNNTNVSSSSFHHSTYNPTTPKSRYGKSIPADVTFTSPIDGSVRKLRDLTGEDLEHLQSSYRTLQGQVVELQIDLDSIRADRDSLVVELRGARDHITELEQEKYELTVKNQNLNKAQLSAEKELNELRGLVRRREEAVERLLSELSEEKQARANAEQAFQARTNEFLVRFDTMKKEMKSLAASLELATSRDNVYGNEKDKLNQFIGSLQGEVADANKSIENLRQDNETLRDEVHLHGEKSKLFDELVPKYQIIRRENDDLLEKMRALQAAYDLLNAERESLSSLVEQKDSLLWMQNQQSENAIRLLQQQLQQQAVSQSKADELQRLQESLQELFVNEGEAIYSELIDAKKLAIMVKDLRDKISLYSMLSQQHEKDIAVKKELETRVLESVSLLSDEERMRESYEKELCMSLQRGYQLVDANLLDGLQRSKYFNAELKPDVKQNAFDREDFKRSMDQSSFNRPSHIFSSLLPGGDAQSRGGGASFGDASDMDGDATVVHLVSQLELARSEVAYLSGQFEASQKENQGLRESLASTQATMQKEFSSLWMSVQELNKLDALKDKSIEELIKERESLRNERDVAIEREQQCKVENEHLRKELQELDINLERAAKSVSNSPSLSLGYHSSPDKNGGWGNNGNAPFTPPAANTSFNPVGSFNKTGGVPLSKSFDGKHHAIQYDPEIDAVDEMLSEKILERQIEELSEFLLDEERLKKARSLRSSTPAKDQKKSDNGRKRFG